MKNPLDFKKTLLISLSILLAGCATPPQPNVFDVSKMNHYASLEPTDQPIKIYIEGNKPMPDGKRLTEEVVTKTKGALTFSKKYDVVTKKKDADLLLIVTGMYGGDSVRKASMVFNTDLWLDDGEAKDGTAATVTAATGTAFVHLFLSGIGAASPITGLVINTAGNLVLDSHGSGVHPYLGYITCTIIEPGKIGINGKNEEEKVMFLAAIRRADASNDDDGFELLSSALIGNIALYLFNAEEYESAFPGRSYETDWNDDGTTPVTLAPEVSLSSIPR
jgi:hypothetical protein